MCSRNNTIILKILKFQIPNTKFFVVHEKVGERFTEDSANRPQWVLSLPDGLMQQIPLTGSLSDDRYSMDNFSNFYTMDNFPIFLTRKTIETSIIINYKSNSDSRFIIDNQLNIVMGSWSVGRRTPVTYHLVSGTE